MDAETGEVSAAGKAGKGLEVATAVAMGTAFDLDTPDDLATLEGSAMSGVAATEYMP